MIRSFLCLVGLTGILLGTLASPTDAATIGSTWAWNPGDPNYNAAVTPQLGPIDVTTLVVGDFVGRNAGNPNAGSYGDSGVSVGWDDTWVDGVGNPNSNGDALDGLWVQIFSDGGWWDLGAAYQNVAVFTSQDHGPYLAEGLEYRVYGTNTLWDDTTLSAQAPITGVYLDGWRAHNPAEDSNQNLWLSDDITGVFDLGAPYRYIKLVAWGAAPLDEPEVDAVAAVISIPEPGAFALVGGVALAVALLVRRRIRG